MFRDCSLHFTIDICQPTMVTCPFGCPVLYLGLNVLVGHWRAVENHSQVVKEDRLRGSKYLYGLHLPTL